MGVLQTVGQMTNMVLSQARGTRNPKLMQLVASHLWEHPFFKSRGMKEPQVMELLQVTSREVMSKDTDVFEYNTEGDLFYIILGGVVEVWVPDPEKTARFSMVESQILHTSDNLQDSEETLLRIQTELKRT
jgi:hypothetical protein